VITTLDRRPIIVAVGDSDVHESALRFAAGEALRDDRPLHLAHVIHPPQGVIGPDSRLVPAEGADRAGRTLLDAQAIRAREITAGRVPVRTFLERGSVVPRLVELSRGADHVVLQHRELGRRYRVFTGTVGAGLPAAAAVPVVSVPELWAGPTTAPVVSVGLDGMHGNEQLLEHAFTEADIRGASLTLVHAWFLPALYDDAVLDRRALHQWRDEVRRELLEQVARWRPSYPGIEIRVEVPHSRPADALVEASGRSDLLLLGHRSSEGAGQVGAMTRAVLREATCPTLVVSQQVATAELGTVRQLASAR
jgi:nucleotide-binding universal stress UspA family protein